MGSVKCSALYKPMYAYVPALESAATTVFMVWLRAWFWCVFRSPLNANC